MIEHKSFELDSKSFDDANGTIELYAATFGDVDRASERIESGAFKNLPDFVSAGWLAVNHDWDRLPIATIDAAHQDEKGLRVTANFHSTPEAQAVRTTIKERLVRGKSVKASIGYRVLADEQVKVDGKSIRSLKSVDLYEASIVNVPCNPAASVVGAKSHKLIGLDEFEGMMQGFRDELKSGRTLSRANIETMLKWAETADAVGNLGGQIRAHVEQHMPQVVQDASPPSPPLMELAKSDVRKNLYRQFLATSAKFQS